MLISILTVLSILTAVSSLTVVYPKVVLTVVFIPTVVYILTVVSSLLIIVHNTVHTLIHVILISAYPAVRVKFYAYVNILVIINKLTYYICWKDKQSANLQLREGKKPTQEQRKQQLW